MEVVPTKKLLQSLGEEVEVWSAAGRALKRNSQMGKVLGR
jgi:hypothetical protein